MYLLVLAIVGAASAVLASAAWPHRRLSGLLHFVVVEAATAWWLLCYLGETLDPPHAHLWFAAKFPAIGLIPPSWLLFVLHHVGRPPRARGWRLLYAWPVLLGPLLFTNGWHHWFFSDIVMRRELVGLNGPLFLVHVAISYACTLAALVLLVWNWRRRRRTLSGVLAAVAMLPWGANILNEFAKASPGISAWLTVNPTLPAFGLSALLMGYAVMRYRLLDPRPVARDLLFESLPELVMVLDDACVVVDANQAALETFAGPDRGLTGRRWADVVGDADGWSGVATATADRVEKPWRAGAATRWFEIERRLLFDPRGCYLGALMMLRDITARKRVEDELRREGNSDRLTGLSNRRYFEDECARLRMGREFPVAVFAFDLDDLKEVNDSLGHAAGDRLLQTMGLFLKQFFRAGDRIFRLGGDEFSVLLPATAAAEADAIGARLGAALAAFNAASAVPLRFSTGWTVIDRADRWDDGLKEADARLYRDKRARDAAHV